MDQSEIDQADAHKRVLAAVRSSGARKVKVAVADIDGVLRGKYVHVDKFFSAVDGGIGFSVFGADLNDRPYDDGYASGRRLGFPDATVALDLGTYRTVPWDGTVPFFLGDFVKPDGSAHPLCPRQVLKRVLARARAMGFEVMAGLEYEFVNFQETPQSWAEKKGRRPQPISHGMMGYSLVEANLHRDYIAALMDDTARFGVPIESLHTETGPGVYEAAILFGDALEASDRAILFKDAARRSARASASCRRSWRSGTRSTRAARATSTRASPTARATCSTIPPAATAACRKSSKATSPGSSRISSSSRRCSGPPSTRTSGWWTASGRR